jgi:RING finger protein 121
MDANLHAQHQGYHHFLGIVLLILLIISQIGLHYWKSRHYRSFQRVTLLGLWLIPFFWSLYEGFYRMLLVWFTFTIATLFILRKASESPLQIETPRRVYGWFFFVYRICYIGAVLGYFLVMIDFTGLSLLVPIRSLLLGVSAVNVGVVLIFYGLYFGVLGRDCAEFCTHLVASKMGFTGKGLPSKKISSGICCICGKAYEEDLAIRLNCSHLFHEWCIRGWTMIGKKETCPYCGEKVENQLNTNPWAKQGVLWAHLLDSIRYLVVWNPVILTLLQILFYFAD